MFWFDIERTGLHDMTTTKHNNSKRRKWLYALLYLSLIIISMIPPYTEKPFAPQDTQDVIINLLMVATEPYQWLGQILHIGILLLVVLLFVYREKMGRVLAAFMGVNFLVIAFVQGMGHTEKYGFVVHTGSLIASALLGIAWIVAAIRGTLKSSFEGVPRWRYFLFPLALLVYWAPYNDQVLPDFNPLRLLISPDCGLTFCFTTPVFLFLLILIYPRVDSFAYRATAFNGLLYGLFNMTHFFNPGFWWIGVMHIPLLILSLVALLLLRFDNRNNMEES